MQRRDSRDTKASARHRVTVGDDANAVVKVSLQHLLHVSYFPQHFGVLSPDELVHELPPFSVHRGKERPDKGEQEHGLDALLEVFRRFRRLLDNAFERPELLEVAIQDVHQALNQAPVHLVRRKWKWTKSCERRFQETATSRMVRA